MSRHEEDELQIACVTWFKLQYPKEIIHHSPNGGKRATKVNKNGVKYSPEAVRFKKMGTHKGFPDIFIATPNKYYHGLFIEMKSSKGKADENQLATHAHLFSKGYCVLLVNNFEDFNLWVTEYMKNI